MSQSPYAGAQATTPSAADFGATTVSGTPRGGQSRGATDGRTVADAPTGAVPTMGPPAGRGQAPGAARRGPRRAELQLRHINPWTVLKFSSVLAVALLLVWLIVIAVLYGVLDGAGVIGKINDTVTTINGSGSKAPITPGPVFLTSLIVGVVNVILFIALSTIGSIVYNLCADLVGGVELTLSER